MRFLRKLKVASSDKQFAEILSGSLWTLLAKAAAMVLTMVTSIYVARVYGAEMTGILALINSLVILAAIFTVLGTKTSILRLVPEHIKKYSFLSAFRVYRKTQFLVAGISLLTASLAFLSSGWVAGALLSKPHLAGFIALAAWFIVTKSILELNTSATRGLRLNRVFAFMHVLPSLIMLGVLMVADAIFESPNVPVYAMFTSWLIPALAGVVIVHIAFQKKISMTANRPVVEDLPAREILSISLPMLMTTSMAFIIGKSGIIVLGIFHSESDVGYYSIAVSLATLTTFVLGAVNSMSASKFSELYHSGEMEEVFRIAKKSTKLIFWTTVPILALLIVFGFPLLSLLYGSNFTVAYPAMILIALGQFVNSICGSTGMFMNMTGHQGVLRNIMFGAALINIAMNLLLTPTYGILGAATSAMISIAFWNVVTLIYIKYKYGKTLGYIPFLDKMLDK
jgi:O-antigen/teichoic acid export membrane protein